MLTSATHATSNMLLPLVDTLLAEAFPVLEGVHQVRRGTGPGLLGVDLLRSAEEGLAELGFGGIDAHLHSLVD